MKFLKSFFLLRKNHLVSLAVDRESWKKHKLNIVCHLIHNPKPAKTSQNVFLGMYGWKTTWQECIWTCFNVMGLFVNHKLLFLLNPPPTIERFWCWALVITISSQPGYCSISKDERVIPYFFLPYLICIHILESTKIIKCQMVKIFNILVLLLRKDNWIGCS